MNLIVRAKKNFAPWFCVPHAINRAAAPITFSVNDTFVGWGIAECTTKGTDRLGCARKSDLPSVSVPVFDICIQMRVIGRGAAAGQRARKCERKSVYARYADRSCAYRPYYACIGTYTVTSWPETRFARLIKQVIIVSAHPIFVRPRERA